MSFSRLSVASGGHCDVIEGHVCSTRRVPVEILDICLEKGLPNMLWSEFNCNLEENVKNIFTLIIK